MNFHKQLVLIGSCWCVKSSNLLCCYCRQKRQIISALFFLPIKLFILATTLTKGFDTLSRKSIIHFRFGGNWTGVYSHGKRFLPRSQVPPLTRRNEMVSLPRTVCKTQSRNNNRHAFSYAQTNIFVKHFLLSRDLVNRADMKRP